MGNNVSGFVYFLAPVNGGPIKIGFSAKPKRRLYNHMTWSPVPLELLADYPAFKYDETMLHEVFAKCRLHSEWFRPTAELLALVEQVKSTGDGPHIPWPTTYFNRGRDQQFRAWREARGLSQGRFADLLETPVEEVDKWERLGSIRGMVRLWLLLPRKGWPVDLNDLLTTECKERDSKLQRLGEAA